MDVAPAAFQQHMCPGGMGEGKAGIRGDGAPREAGGLLPRRARAIRRHLVDDGAQPPELAHQHVARLGGPLVLAGDVEGAWIVELLRVGVDNRLAEDGRYRRC